MANQQFDERQTLWSCHPFFVSDSTDPQLLLFSISAPVRLDSIFCANYDSIDHTVTMGYDLSTLIGAFASVTVPAAVGGKPSIVEVVGTAFNTQQACIIPAATNLNARLLEAVTDDATPVIVSYFGGTL